MYRFIFSLIFLGLFAWINDVEAKVCFIADPDCLNDGALTFAPPSTPSPATCSKTIQSCQTSLGPDATLDLAACECKCPTSYNITCPTGVNCPYKCGGKCAFDSCDCLLVKKTIGGKDIWNCADPSDGGTEPPACSGSTPFPKTDCPCGCSQGMGECCKLCNECPATGCAPGYSEDTNSCSIGYQFESQSAAYPNCKKCVQCASSYVYSASNCSGNKIPAGDSCGYLYKNCRCSSTFPHSDTICYSGNNYPKPGNKTCTDDRGTWNSSCCFAPAGGPVCAKW